MMIYISFKGNDIPNYGIKHTGSLFLGRIYSKAALDRHTAMGREVVPNHFPTVRSLRHSISGHVWGK